jgi:hypothetical protein
MVALALACINEVSIQLPSLACINEVSIQLPFLACINEIAAFFIQFPTISFLASPKAYSPIYLHEHLARCPDNLLVWLCPPADP